ncbi:MAG: TonB-dependent receptor plug domain-containing protein [Clostridium sp.]|nr:TonB-dependent receptor plug domain-containing protein [Bacteroides sp.]MCM1198585.1 TonB-dependent receptor plug domain-containing protein [Clostridium sp.]
MKTNLFLVGITILSAALTVSAADVQVHGPYVPKCKSGVSGEQKTSLYSTVATSGDQTAASPATVAMPVDSEKSDTWSGTPLDTLSLQEVTISATFSNAVNSPLRLTAIDNATLKSRAASRTYPELLKGVPGLYATSESGSYGDAKLNIRGFGQDNISVMLNGIPISGLVSGSMYWNNWMGLSDATYAIQLQKGIGSSMLSDGSVGGTVNIITDASSELPGGEAGVYASGYGTVKSYIKVSSGQLPKGWALNLMASYVGGNGYVDATAVSAFSYMLNVSKRFGSGHTLLFTALGSPENHEQRSTRLSWDEVREHGLKYNRNWGWRDGKAFNLNKNNYFKPYFTMQHMWNGERISMKNSVYLALASGGGRWSETKGMPLTSYISDSQIDWDAIVAANTSSNVSDGALAPGREAKNILSDYQAGHTQAGAITSAEYRLTDSWTLGAGLHYMFYSTWEREQITDLLGADWWYEDYEGNSLAGLAGRDPVKHVGDFVRTDNGKITNHGTAYLTASYDSERLHANAGASVFGSATRRWDRYNYVGDDVYSDVASGVGASVKAGLLYKPGRGHSIYINGGWYSRLPYSSVYFSSGNNEITKGVKNERNILGEIGWRYVWNMGGLELTAYAAYWKNKSLMSSKYKQIDADDTKYMVTGLDAFHYGAELEVFHRFTQWLKLSAFASLGDWRWKNDVQAIIYDDYTMQEIGRVNVYSDGLPVGDAPQTQIGAVMDVDMPAGFHLSVDWQFNDRMYADFDPVTRTDASDRAPSYRIPSYHLLGTTLSWSSRQAFRTLSGPSGNGQDMNYGKGRSHGRELGLTLFVTGSNLLDSMYIERGKDGATHGLDTFRGFWGFGRTFSFGLRLAL